MNQIKSIPRKEFAKVWFKEQLNQMEIKEDRKKYPYSIYFYINNKVVMEQDEKNERLWVNYKKIWSFFESEFNLNWLEIKDLIRDMVEEHFKMRSFKLLFF